MEDFLDKTTTKTTKSSSSSSSSTTTKQKQQHQKKYLSYYATNFDQTLNNYNRNYNSNILWTQS